MTEAVILLGLCSIQQNKWVKSGAVLKMKTFHVQLFTYLVLVGYLLVNKKVVWICIDSKMLNAKCTN